MPTRHAASTLLRMPPTGTSAPDSVNSPVIATLPCTARPVRAETRATAMVTPADTPSFGCPPAGRCTCTSASRSNPASTPARRSALSRTQVRATSADSVASGPSAPVTRSRPRPGTVRASTNSTSPPATVAARPTATPACRVRAVTSSPRYGGSPYQWTSASGPMAPGAGQPSAIRRAARRHSARMRRSRPHTPGSRV